jgi:sulfonate transport system permease protein
MNDTTRPVVYWPNNFKWLQRLLPPISDLAVRLSYAAVGILLPLTVLGLWQYAVSHEWIAIQLLPPPELVWQSLFDLLDSGDLTHNMAISLSRIFWSVLIGSSIGWILGFSVALSKTARAYVYPSFEVFSQFPVVGWIPLLIIFLGIDEGLKIAAISIAVVVPVTVATYKGISNIPRNLLEVAQVYRFSRSQVLLRVVLPAALPSLFSGFRQGIMQAWLALVFVELLASGDGVGYLMGYARLLMQLDLVFVGVIVIGIIGVALDLILSVPESRLKGWLHIAYQEK